ncbi:atp dependent lon protease family member [Holotrichia oblita]|nr:atp dependent lon protease family member [Holotrichia oblita]
MERIQANESFKNIKISDNSVNVYKMIVLRGIVVFPGQTIHFDIARNKSVIALNKAMENNEDVFLVAQKHNNNSNPGPKDIYRVGTLAKIKQILKLPNEGLRVLVTGYKRMEIENYTLITPHFEVALSTFEDNVEDPIRMEAVKRAVKTQYENYKRLENKIPIELASSLEVDDLDKFISVMSMYVYTTDEQKQSLLQIKNRCEQFEDINRKLARECEIMLIEKKINADVRASIDKNQKEYYLREQIKAIKNELGENENEIDEYRQQMETKVMLDYVKEKIKKELSKMEKMAITSPESSVSRTYIEWLLELPWTEKGEDNLDLIKARQILDEDHFGLEKVKDRIIEYLAVRQLSKDNRAPILCFVGPPGVGKTSIVSSIARAAGKKFVSMSLGGVRDEAEIRGHRRTYIGSLPGRIITSMKQAKVINPVFLFDEIDKMSSDYRGDPASAMLEVLDANQNKEFKDHYLEIPYDLSQITFVMTANQLEPIPPALFDRMEIIELSGYTYNEKLQIAKKYLIPKQLKFNGLEGIDLNITDETLISIIEGYTHESGVRNLEREIATIARKIAVKVVGGVGQESYMIERKDLEQYLGPIKFNEYIMNEKDEVGLATGLAWTSVGGVTLDIEVALIDDGKGEMTLTGSLGDVMKESCQTALSLVRRRAAEYNIPMDKFTKFDVHLHMPEGATPKDGPSAGITITTALMSAMTGRKIKRNVAMTGEVTLRGRVLAIGGLKEKSLAALRVGAKTLIVPEDNRKDLQEIPDEVKNSLEIVFADNIDKVFETALI